MAVLCFFLAAACCFDYSRGKIPNLLLAAMLAAGIAAGFEEAGAAGVFLFLARTFIVIFFLFPFFKIGTLGAGDVKLLGICSGYLPGHKILFFLFFSMLTAAVLSLIKLWKNNNAKERFLCLGNYVARVIETGRFRLYMENGVQRKKAGICLSGPVLCSVLLHWGGIY